MYCGICNVHVSKCTCPDINERLKGATQGGHFAYKKCTICDKHYSLCKCENPEWGIEYNTPTEKVENG
ncbi:hypothetical protein LCGC14_1053030 [marine sediment metagenome]|uniref:Uncharacterized protein n=1 Tax=marine sediment metagenome TaxID=412755 RepID=A0A0F9Q6G4_9ZZZZ